MAAALQADHRVEDIESEGMDEGRFFVHLRAPWCYSHHAGDAVRTKSFSSLTAATRAVRAAVQFPAPESAS